MVSVLSLANIVANRPFSPYAFENISVMINARVATLTSSTHEMEINLWIIAWN
jgi:hypothetical protein